MRTCTCCNETKDDLLFRDRILKNRSYLRYVCKQCENKRALDSYYKNHTKNKQKGKDKQLKLNYGITREEFNILLESQNYKCAICGTTDSGSRDWHVDHCHTTGRVRGLLCHHCNTGIGLLKDDPIIIKNALEYLSK